MAFPRRITPVAKTVAAAGCIGERRPSGMYEHDVLVIGAGLAGMRAAIEACNAGADVAVLTKVHPVRSHSNAAQGGINAAMGGEGSDDTWQLHAYDTVKG